MSNEKIKFEKLTPTINFDLNTYEDGLNFVFENKDIRNVAITGPYGAGKTSLIETYKAKYPDINCIHISLAHFTSEKKEDDPSIDESVLEGKILNQLLHQIDSNRIPKTNFKVKQKVSRLQVTKNTISLLIFSIVILYILLFNSWVTYISQLSPGWLKDLLKFSLNHELLLFSGILAFLILGKGVYDLIIIQSNRNIFKRLNLQGNEIEIFEESNESYFDKYLNEVLYIFENSDADAIIFEDIDRYNVSQIFGKLREINTLVNSKRLIKGSKPIRFIFLLRDDVFISKDRTKFFDFILPVVPVIDGSNSYEQFLEHFKHENPTEFFDNKFLQGLSLYIDDMRILKNIYNEFLVYKNRLNTIELNHNKLLALITYKNIFPKDFSELQLSTGYVYTLFTKKMDFVNAELAAYEEEIVKKEDLITLILNEKIESIDELDALYFNSGYHISVVNGKDVSAFKSRIELIKEIKKYPNNVQIINIYRNHVSINFQDELDKLENITEYVERRKTINGKTNSQIEVLKIEIQKFHKMKAELTNGKLQKIINKSNIDTIFKTNYINEIGKENKFEEIKSSPYFPLIKYLIRNGYIDETYSDYMTYFYANSLSVSDKIFLRSISDQVSKEYTYELKDPRLIISRLNILDFENIEILNYDLLYCLLNEQDSNQFYLKVFIQQLKDTMNFSFIEGYLEQRRGIEPFINIINKFWQPFFGEVIDVRDYSDSLKKQLALDYLKYSSRQDLLAVNTNNCLTNYISTNANFLDIPDPDIDKLIKRFSLIDVKFNKINYLNSHSSLLQGVYENHLYELNYELIGMFLEKKYAFTESEEFKHKNFTLISSKKDESLYLYVIDNIEAYLEIILDNCNEEISDDEAVVLNLINNPSIDFETKDQYIKYLQTKIENINDVKDKEIWPLIIQKQLVFYNEKNILEYYFNSGNDLDENLIQFINSYNTTLAFNKNDIKESFGEEASNDFFRSLIQCNKLSNERYKTILEPFNFYYKSFSFEEISNEKIEILFDLSVIRMNEATLLFIRSHYGQLVIPFIIQNIKAYTSLINENNFSFDEVLKLLDKPVNNTYKIQLLKFTNNIISVREKNFTKDLKIHILKNNFDFDDIQYLLDTYVNENDDIKAIIKQLIMEHFEDILNEKLRFSYALLKELLQSEQFSKIQKKELFVICLPTLNLSQTIELLNILGLRNYMGLFERKRPKISISDLDEQILTIFKRKDWITRFEVDKDDSSYFRAYGRDIKENIRS